MIPKLSCHALQSYCGHMGQVTSASRLNVQFFTNGGVTHKALKRLQTLLLVLIKTRRAHPALLLSRIFCIGATTCVPATISDYARDWTKSRNPVPISCRESPCRKP